MTYMPNTIFSCQTTFKNTKFQEFGLKNANLATLCMTQQSQTKIIISRAEFPTKIYHSVSKNSVSIFKSASARNLPKPSSNLPNRHKKSSWPKKAKNKKAKGVKKKAKGVKKKAKNYKFGL